MWRPAHLPKSPRMKFAYGRGLAFRNSPGSPPPRPTRPVSETFAETDQGYAAYKGLCGHFAGEAFGFRYFFFS